MFSKHSPRHAGLTSMSLTSDSNWASFDYKSNANPSLLVRLITSQTSALVHRMTRFNNSRKGRTRTYIGPLNPQFWRLPHYQLCYSPIFQIKKSTTLENPQTFYQANTVSNQPYWDSFWYSKLYYTFSRNYGLSNSVFVYSLLAIDACFCWRWIRDSNPWPSRRQRVILTNWTNSPNERFSFRYPPLP